MRVASHLAGRRLSWYGRRLRRFMPGELRWRALEAVEATVWRRRWAGTPLPDGAVLTSRRFASGLDLATVDVEPARRDEVLAAADSLLDGRLPILGVERTDLLEPEWRSDGLADGARPADLGTRPGGAGVVSLKHAWELSRGHVLTVLAAAYGVSGDGRYAQRCAALLRSWWAANPGPEGLLWSSGIELAQRLISWVWVRRLLHPWDGAPALFENDPAALRQLWLHQEQLSRFPSRFSSANNHRFGEAAGLLAASCAFPWFATSRQHATNALEVVETELRTQVAPCGMQREQAFDYHCFVLDLALVALTEATLAELSVSAASWGVVRRMADAVGELADHRGRGPRFGDSDDSSVARLDGLEGPPATRTLALAAACLGPATSWPAVKPDVRATAFGALTAGRRPQTARSATTSAARIGRETGPVVLRGRTEDDQPTWCALRTGPFGYLPIAAHAHADQLSVELRVGDVDVLVDPGTYCYDALPGWRAWLRSTAAHDTVHVDGADQAESGGSFLWGTAAPARVHDLVAGGGGEPARCRASHDGYLRLADPTRHVRTVVLHGDHLELVDVLERRTPAAVSIVLTFGPGLTAEPAGATGVLCDAGDGTLVRIELDPQLTWRIERATSRGPGWASARFGEIAPTTALVGSGNLPPRRSLHTLLRWATGPRVPSV